MGVDRNHLPDHLREMIEKAEAKLAAKKPPEKPKQRPTAKARAIDPDKERQNKHERIYDDHLKARLQRGEIVFYKFEPFNLRLAENTYYRPDFVVIASDGTVEIHEVKGFWRDDARVKIKAVAAMFWPFVFVAIQIKAGHFVIETFNQSKP